MRFIFSLLILLSSLSVQAQDYSVSDRKAIKCYEVGLQSYNAKSLHAALDKLNKATEIESEFIEAHLLKFETYVELKDYEGAEQSLVKALTINPDFFPNGHYFFGNLKFAKGDYQTAQVALKKFLTYQRTNPNMQEDASRKLANCEFAIEAMENPIPFEPMNMGAEINSEFPEYFPSLTTDDNTLLFTRRIKESDGLIQEDFYVANRNEGEWEQAFSLDAINTKLNEGAPSISPDGQLLIFTACQDNTGSYGEVLRGLGSCDLFYSFNLGANNWSKPKNLGSSINSANWETQPSFSSDGRTLYFIRGIKLRDGSTKNQDIYRSQLNDMGEWTKAEKLPANINTPMHESSVLIHPDGQTLYFTSNGHIGMGGEDIFLSRLQADGSWGDPINLGYPINTSGDENSITVLADGKMALFASDRPGGYGDLDLYSFELAEGYRPIKVSYMEGTVLDKVTGKPLNARFELIDLASNELIVESYSNPSDGTFLVSIPEGRDYALNVEHKGYLFFSENFALAEQERDEPYKRTIKLSPIRTGESVVLKNVFFGTDSYVLSDESKTELGTLVSFLNKNYRLKVEIGGHTDNVGSTAHNLSLSQNRAKAVRIYLIEQGIPEERLISKGYGDSNPIASNDTETGKSQNRRTEFKVISLD